MFSPPSGRGQGEGRGKPPVFDAALADILFYAALGAAAGFFAGLLGIGGGVLISPLLILFLSSRMPAEVVTHVAIATALAVTVATTASSFFTHARGGGVNWRTGKLLALSAGAGALIVGLHAWRIPAAFLQTILAVFLFVTGAQMLRRKKVSQTQTESQTSNEPRLPVLLLSGVGAAVGGLSAVLGIAGGMMIVPFLSRKTFAMRRAIGTSAFVGFPLTIAACLGYVLGGWENESLPEGSWGFVYPPAFAGIALFSVVFAAVGARATARLSETLLRKIFAVLLIIVASRLLFGLFA